MGTDIYRDHLYSSIVAMILRLVGAMKILIHLFFFRSRVVMLRYAQYLGADHDRLFAALRVTDGIQCRELHIAKLSIWRDQPDEQCTKESAYLS
jgi:hypothetical protein